MRRPFLPIFGFALITPVALFGQDAAVCSDTGTVASLAVQSGAVIEGLTLWRGTIPTEATTPEWREIVCMPAESTEGLTVGEIPVDWGLPDLTTIESLLLASAEVDDLRSAEAAIPIDVPAMIVGTTWGQGEQVKAREGVRAVVIDPTQPEEPLHVVVAQVSSTLVEVLVESRAGSVGLTWMRSVEDPVWRSVPSS